MKGRKVMAIVLLLMGIGDLLLRTSANDVGMDTNSVLEREEGLALETFRERQLQFSIASVLKTGNLVYPDNVDPYKALVNYDEVPTPIPFGPSVWFIIITTLAITWYVTELVRYLVKRFTSKLKLYPKTEAFPRLYVHWLQQSKRECNLRREARNTWCYTAKTLLMSPEDPLMNIQEACSTSWEDMQHHRNIWQIVKVVVIANGMLRQIRERNKYLKATEKEKAEKEKVLQEETEATEDSVPPTPSKKISKQRKSLSKTNSVKEKSSTKASSIMENPSAKASTMKKNE